MPMADSELAQRQAAEQGQAQRMRAGKEAEDDPAFRQEAAQFPLPRVPVLYLRPTRQAAKSFMRSSRMPWAIRKASSSAWLALSRGSQAVW